MRELKQPETRTYHKENSQQETRPLRNTGLQEAVRSQLSLSKLSLEACTIKNLDENETSQGLVCSLKMLSRNCLSFDHVFTGTACHLALFISWDCVSFGHGFCRRQLPSINFVVELHIMASFFFAELRVMYPLFCAEFLAMCLSHRGAVGRFNKHSFRTRVMYSFVLQNGFYVSVLVLRSCLSFAIFVS